MEPAHETKRPRLSTSEATWPAQHLPPLQQTPSSYPPPSHPPHPQQHPQHAQHPPPSYAVRPPDHLPGPPSGHHHLNDRHQHEQDPYPPMQDPHRHPPPPSPAHPHTQSPYLPYPPQHREPTVKRDPADEAILPHLRRPNSNGVPPNDGIAPPSHIGAPPPPHHPVVAQHPDDPRRPMSFDNGQTMAQSPTAYRHNATGFQPPGPAPISHHAPYEPSSYAAPPTPTSSMYPHLEISTSASNAKRKAQRASQACDSCRQLKAKCDETKPCKNCREKNVQCVYREPVAKQPDKVSADILDMLISLKDEFTGGLQRLENRMDKTDKRLSSRLQGFEESLRQMNPSALVPAGNLKIEPTIEEEQMAQQSPMTTRAASPPMQASYSHDEGQYGQDEGAHHGEAAADSPGNSTTMAPPLITSEDAHATLRQHMEDDQPDEQPGPPVKPGNSKMNFTHTTLAGLLLTWPSIERLVQRHLADNNIRFPGEYPIRQEQQRGLIRVFGSGEGFDQDIRSVEYATQMDQAMTDIHDDYSDVASPAPPGEVWGQVGGLSPPPNVTYKGGSVNMDGNPDYSPDKVWKYVDSFKKNILNMHPIIIPGELDAMVKLFLDALPPSMAKQTQRAGSFTKFASQPSSTTPTGPEATAGAKRKRQSSPGPEDGCGNSFTFQKTGRPYRSIHSALVLVVIALGKICLHKTKIPDVVHETSHEAQAHGSPYRNGVLPPPSPIQGSPPGFSQSQSSGLPSPQDTSSHPNERGIPAMSRRASLQGHMPRPQATLRKNYDIIPGLEYFALATDIMGSHLGGYNLKHVYVFIFAGLYHGQLGRILESWSYINKASQTLHVIMRPSLSRLGEKTPDAEARRDNQLLFAFWTCLQLESDILAELPLAASPLLAHEETLHFPNIMAGKSYPEPIVASYFAQLHLRKRLNDIHSSMYTPKNRPHSRIIDNPDVEEIIAEVQSQLLESRHQWAPEYYQWRDEEPPAPDLLHARIRAKYWGSQVIIHRPFIKCIIDNEPPPQFKASEPLADFWNICDIHMSEVPRHLDIRTLFYARQGVRALIESTRAFHGLPREQRIIITNHFGTAHAQWGNLLTLSAVYKDRWLSKFISKELLTELFIRTIEWFRFIAVPTSPLQADLNILVGLATDLGLVRVMDGNIVPMASSSFSSNGTLPGPPPLQIPEDVKPPPPSSTASHSNMGTPTFTHHSPQLPLPHPNSGRP